VSRRASSFRSSRDSDLSSEAAARSAIASCTRNTSDASTSKRSFQSAAPVSTASSCAVTRSVPGALEVPLG
jgi:hypothetical protein